LSLLNSGWPEICWDWANYNGHKKLGPKFLLGQKIIINCNRPKNHMISHWAKIGLYSNGLPHQMLPCHQLCYVKPPCHAPPSQMLPRQMNKQLGIGSVMVAGRHRFSQSMMIFNKRHEI
jgi:hypothetical protein